MACELNYQLFKVPQRKVSPAIQPQLPIVEENSPANANFPTDTLNVIGATNEALLVPQPILERSHHLLL